WARRGMCTKSATECGLRSRMTASSCRFLGVSSRTSASTMRTKDLAALLIDYAQSTSVKSIIAAAPYLKALAHTFGDRDVRGLTAKDLHAFHTQIYASPA